MRLVDIDDIRVMKFPPEEEDPSESDEEREYRNGWNDALTAINDIQPSAQPEIIRCEDCRHWKSNEFIGNNDVSTILLHTYPCKTGITDAKWFCGYGKRKQDE